jgi:hypothetical protein
MHPPLQSHGRLARLHDMLPHWKSQGRLVRLQDMRPPLQS